MTDPVEEKADKAAAENLPARKSASKKSSVSRAPRPASERHVIGGGETDTVRLDAIEYDSQTRKKSLSVYHLQRRLGEVGFSEAGADIEGTYGELTRRSVEAFQRDEGLEPDEYGIVDAETLERLFDNDSNVTLVL